MDSDPGDGGRRLPDLGIVLKAKLSEQSDLLLAQFMGHNDQMVKMTLFVDFPAG